MEEPLLINTWDTDARGGFRYAVEAAIDPQSVEIDPLAHL